MNTTPPHSTLAIAIAVCAAVLALSACDRQDPRSAGQQLDSAIAKTERAASEAKADIQRETAQATSSMQQEAAQVKAAAGDAADRAKSVAGDASAKAGSAMDRATEKVSETVSDAGITAGVNAELAKDPALSALRINVDTANGLVSLHGTAPSSTARDRATTLAKSVKGVLSVNNQLEVRG